MQVDDALIEKLAELSMLTFNAEEKKEIKSDLEKMIGFIDKLQELDTTGVEPLMHMSEELISAFDIRGTEESGLDVECAWNVGKALADWLPSSVLLAL